MVDFAGIGSVISGLSGLLGGGGPSSGKAQKASHRQAEGGVTGLAQGARRAAEEFGFNPLTLLGVGGGGGYSGDFNPALSSGAFIADAIGRGLDSWYSADAGDDPQAMRLRMNDYADKAARSRPAALPPRTFGYDLTAVEPYSSAAETTGPVLRPKPNPLREGNRETVIVMTPGGDGMRLDATIAGRKGINKMDRLSWGDWTELRGELYGEGDAAVVNTTEPIGGGVETGGLGPLVPPKLPPWKPKFKKGWEPNSGSGQQKFYKP